MENERSSAALGMTSPIAKLGIIGLGASPAPLDIAVNVALPAITDHFALALSDVQWLVVCYVLVYGSLMLVCGKMGDLVGHRLIFRTGLVVTAMGCVACAIAPDWPMFLLARTVQGVGTALALACTPALATAVYPPEQRVKALAVYAMALSLAATLGPFLGGILVDMWDWQAVFWVRVPIALLAPARCRHLTLSHGIWTYWVLSCSRLPSVCYCWRWYCRSVQRPQGGWR
jgi:MFS family permease